MRVQLPVVVATQADTARSTKQAFSGSLVCSFFVKKIYLLIHFSNHSSVALNVSDERPTCWISKRRMTHPADVTWDMQAMRGHTTRHILWTCVATDLLGPLKTPFLVVKPVFVFDLEHQYCWHSWSSDLCKYICKTLSRYTLQSLGM